MNNTEIRQAFLDFFRSKEHTIVPSAPMVIKNDPTLMFTNAGMNQFKDIFLGNREAAAPRVADTQKCLRVSGKHNDLEEVGHDTYHHTMFEMLGNWSFGDYFKKEAIAWGWEFLTEVVKIDKESLYVTVFEGDEKEGLAPDMEAFEFWRQHLPEERILFGSKKDNFWEMGDTGPCGPCSEVHADIRDAEQKKKVAGRDLVNKGDPHVIEIWNLVFIQFNRKADGKLTELPARHVDTGMGFERLCMVLQGKRSNYDTDIFQPIIQAIARKAGLRYGDESRADVAMRVIADHLRAIAFAIADGQLPSNVKAGYVIRRILRRAVRYGYAFLGFREPFLHELMNTLIAGMGHVFPEIIAQKDLIGNVIREEEAAFLRTLSTGIQRFSQYIETATGKGGDRVIDGAFAFELFDTYGFPIDLTQLMAREVGWSVDMQGFNAGLEAQKARSRQDAAVTATDWTVLADQPGIPEFTGYDRLEEETFITKYRQVTLKGETLYHIVLARTPFYAESGGQVGDAGKLISGGSEILITGTIKENDLIIQLAKALPADLAAPLRAVVDQARRTATANNHSATHLLHAALRQVLGTHVEQKGSLVDENRLRFDFTHFAKLTPEEIHKVEMLVNARIRQNIGLQEAREVPVAEAKAMGAMALFGEKYGDHVRVITFDPKFSVELCGGTHVAATGQIGQFKILSEGAIAAGIRRIEAITGEKAEEYWYSQELLLKEISGQLKNPREILKELGNLVRENQELKKEVAELGKLKTRQMLGEMVSRVRPVNGINFLAERVGLDAESMKNLAYELQAAVPDLYLVLAAETDGKALLTVMVAESLIREKGMHAGNIIRELSREIQGGGGGQPHIATAGGKNPAGIGSSLEKAARFIPE
ncbi:MAG TPA: alanine--tRNA ligase [Bacteroidales bacterium]|nr:alanine--tRNA ligase [Bacteroidales bacterium]